LYANLKVVLTVTTYGSNSLITKLTHLCEITKQKELAETGFMPCSLKGYDSLYFSNLLNHFFFVTSTDGTVSRSGIMISYPTSKVEQNSNSVICHELLSLENCCYK
jgi:hypothetical protein